MSNRSIIDARVAMTLSEHGDARLAKHGFVRRTKKWLYKRAHSGSKQYIEVYTARHAGGCISDGWHMGCVAEVEIPEVQLEMKRLAEMCEDAQSESVGKGLQIVVNFLAPYEESSPWASTMRDPDDASIRTLALIEFLERHCVPLLDCLWSSSDLCTLAASDDARGKALLQLPMAAIAAMLVCHRPQDAYTILHKRFGKLGPRRRMRRLFEHVASRAGVDPPTF